MKVKRESKVTQSCPTLSDPVDRSLPGSSIHGIFQARVLEWGAIAFSMKYVNVVLILLYSQVIQLYVCKYFYIHTYTFFIFFSIMVYPKLLNIVLYAV